MANSTQDLPNFSLDFVCSVIQAVSGGLIAAGNLVLFAAICKYEALRDSKHYLMLAALALADGVRMCAFLTSGVYRASLEAMRVSELVTPRTCITRPHFILWSFSNPLACCMLLTLSLDRLLFMLWPLKYISKGTRYAKVLIVATYIFWILYGLAYLGGTFYVSDQAVMAPRCYMASDNPLMSAPIVGPFFSVVHVRAPMLTAVLSVLFFLISWPVYVCFRNNPAGNNNQSLKIKNQREFTKSVAVSTLCTVVLFIIPWQIAYKIWLLSPLAYRMAWFLWLISMTNPLANVYIYHLKHQHTKQAVIGLFKGKQMPPNIDLWHVHGSLQVVPKQGQIP